jgi:hypothetical protein
VVLGFVILLVAVAGGLAAWAAVAGVKRAVETRLGEAGAELRRVADAAGWRERGTEDLRREVTAFRESLERMRVREEERRRREDEAWTVLHRVSSVLAGSQRTGRAGENVLHDALAGLPPSMLVRDFRVNGRVVEFGVILPDGRRLPVDSKWPAERELVALAQTTDPDERERLVRAIERTVAERAREVAGYRDAALTAPIGVVAVPDAAYAVLRRAHAEAYRQGVVVISYSMALPVVLFLHGIVARFGAVGDVQSCLTDLSSILDSVEATLENKVARASTMLMNGAEELRGQMGKARSTLARVREPATPDRTLAAVPAALDLGGRTPPPSLAILPP